MLLERTGYKGEFTAHYYGVGNKKKEIKTEQEADEIISAVSAAPFVVESVKRADKRKSPSPPFITASLQQEASRKLGMTPRRTMSIAQQLYEGVDISGEGTVGLITYMRTDSLRISDEALSEAGSFIKSRYGEQYYPGKPTRYKTSSGAQDAHEAIRPSSVRLTPESVKADLTTEQFKLYRLIWSRFISSQMTPAVYDSVSINVVSAGYSFRATHSSLKFAGFTTVYEESRDDEQTVKAEPLPDLEIGETVRMKEAGKEQKFTQPPQRYTEATLVRAMEEKGIGRPSTYAPTISTILDREYVVKEGKYLKSTPLGEVVTGLMKEKFPDIVDLQFTANMEKSLDNVEEGKKNWKELLGEFYTGFDDTLQNAEKSLEGERIKVPDEVSDEICEKCGRHLVVKNGRFGRFLACPGYPECSFTKPITVEMPGRCPLCGGHIMKRTSKKGYTYYACEKNPTCGFMTWDVPVKDDCPKCGHTMFKKSGRGYKRPFCINEACENFVPEEKRGYKKKTAAGEEAKESIKAEKAKKSKTEKAPAAAKTKAAAKKAKETK